MMLQSLAVIIGLPMMKVAAVTGPGSGPGYNIFTSLIFSFR